MDILMYSANLAFIITNLYGWLLKRFYVPAPLKDSFKELYPAHRQVAALYLLQLFELPYLINIGQPAALFYVNGTAVMFFSAYIYVIVKGYFFLDVFSARRLFLFMLPVILCWLALLLPVFGIVKFSSMYQNTMFCIVSLVGASYIFFLIHFRNKIHRLILKLDENEYSNEGDFPLQFAKRMEWLPLSLCAFIYICFVINHPIAKMVRDLFFIVTNVWFVFYTLNPHRTTHPELNKAIEEEDAGSQGKVSHHRLSETKCKEIEDEMLKLLVDDKLFLAEHFTMSDLVHRISTNKNYLNEVISRSKYGSFYNMINTLRVEYACEIMSENPKMKLEQVAFSSGFSSGSAFSQVFKRIKGVAPSDYIVK